MANIASLTLNAPEPVNLDDYPVLGGGRKFPVKGRYTLRTADAFPQEAFGTSRAGALTVQIDPTIVGPSGEGRQLRYTRISGKVFQRSGKPASQIGDYLKAVGETGVYGSWQDIADAVERTAGRVFEADLDWRAYDKTTGRSVEGMENFPSDGNGGHVPYLLSETETDEEGNAKRLWANLEITRFIVATQ